MSGKSTHRERDRGRRVEVANRAREASASDLEAVEADLATAQADIATLQALVAALRAPVTPATIASAGNETYTAAQLAGKLIARDPAGADRTDTTDTGTAIVAACALDVNGRTAVCYVVNTADAAEAITLAPGSGVTIANAGQTIGQNESAVLVLVRTSATTVTVYIVGA